MKLHLPKGQKLIFMTINLPFSGDTTSVEADGPALLPQTGLKQQRTSNL